ncbi:hypothetical protein FIV31_00545 [Coxiella endosymbiont of Ornithodoros amblus]|uniref:hypothetical protein n=1 Tax=Coxiella endosymbiont of Ornithodoros amblus TaxID=1656166 RepID=UPI00244DA6B7|nr:hypothetical protein [Coxiella endosymbiont of Ornithodoros amblus]MBW5802311.1 hypothetical protein [Coxiella endosymbiont of Ornithodoros amblus]
MRLRFTVKDEGSGKRVIALRVRVAADKGKISFPKPLTEFIAPPAQAVPKVLAVAVVKVEGFP